MRDANGSLEGKILSGKELIEKDIRDARTILDGFHVYTNGQRHYLVDKHGDEYYIFIQYNMGAGCD